jgi:hypothetical protein
MAASATFPPRFTSRSTTASGEGALASAKKPSPAGVRTFTTCPGVRWARASAGGSARRMPRNGAVSFQAARTGASV